jgi:hypothetical protein
MSVTVNLYSLRNIICMHCVGEKNQVEGVPRTLKSAYAILSDDTIEDDCYKYKPLIKPLHKGTYSIILFL